MTTTPSFTAGMRVEVVLPVPFDHGFDYLVPEGVELGEGDYVVVPFGKRELVGMVWGAGRQDVDASKCKPVEAPLEQIPPASKAYRDFLRWVAWYYMAPLGMVLKLGLLPAKTLQQTPREDGSLRNAAHINTLSEAQKRAGQALVGGLGGFGVTLLEGVTGSGKTEVYFEAMEAAMAEGEQVLVLLPEIALTHGWVERCAKRFGFEPILWHSSVTPAKRRDAWHRIAKGEAKLVVGARSALFLPFPNLSLAVIDEEHETSYKQEDGVPYHARDMAIARARQEDFATILVSATPSLETRCNVEQGKYRHVQLHDRHGAATLPLTHLIDMRQEKLSASEFISGELREGLLNRLQEKQQSVLFLNRRGYAPLMLCRTCGHRFQCEHCSSWMVLHKHKARLQCHHCGHSKPMPTHCPECGNDTLAACGPGVERIAQEAQGLFPSARVEVLSSDDSSYTSILRDMEAGEIDILIGTQLLAKGHNFPRLTLVGIIDADMGLSGGDIRANEHTYQLLHQMGGRAGRADMPGVVLMQTFQPEHPVLKALAEGKEQDFLSLEAEHRRMAQLPPYGRLASLLIDGRNEREVQSVAQALVRSFPKHAEIRLLGPAPAPLSKLRNQYRYRLIIKAPKALGLQQHMAPWLAALQLPKNVRVKVDIDPYSFV